VDPSSSIAAVNFSRSAHAPGGSERRQPDPWRCNAWRFRLFGRGCTSVCFQAALSVDICYVHLFRSVYRPWMARY
jgi:hypothetical protein